MNLRRHKRKCYKIIPPKPAALRQKISPTSLLGRRASQPPGESPEAGLWFWAFCLGRKTGKRSEDEEKVILKQKQLWGSRMRFDSTGKATQALRGCQDKQPPGPSLHAPPAPFPFPSMAWACTERAGDVTRQTVTPLPGVQPRGSGGHSTRWVPGVGQPRAKERAFPQTPSAPGGSKSLNLTPLLAFGKIFGSRANHLQ